MKLNRTPAHKLFLVMLKRSPNNELTMSFRELSESLCVTTRGVAYMIKRLEAKGIISIEKTPGRTNTYTFTNPYKLIIGE